MQLLEKDKEIKALESKILAHSNNSFIMQNRIHNHNHSRMRGNMDSNYSSNSSLCSNSRSKSKIKDDEKSQKRKTPLPYQKMKIQEKLIQFRRLINKNISEMTRNKSVSKIASLRDKSRSNLSMRTKERIFEHDLSIISKKNEPISQRFNEASIKSSNSKEVKNKTPVKKIPYSSKSKKTGMFIKKKENKISNKLLKQSVSGDIPFVINQSEAPCFNNINIYTGNQSLSSTNNQSNYNTSHQLNLRQFIFNKCTNNANHSNSKSKY